MSEAKQALRASTKSLRMALSAEETAERSAALFALWSTRFSFSGLSFVHCFQSITKFREVDTQPFIDLLARQQPAVKLVVPVVDKINDVLKHAHVSEEVTMETNAWGIPEPKMPLTWIAPSQLDMVLVPMLCFDSEGNRIGYGKGFYDGFLSKTRPDCLKIGLCFDLGFVPDGVPSEPHDQPLDFVVTESRIYQFKPNPAAENSVQSKTEI